MDGVALWRRVTGLFEFPRAFSAPTVDPYIMHVRTGYPAAWYVLEGLASRTSWCLGVVYHSEGHVGGRWGYN